MKTASDSNCSPSSLLMEVERWLKGSDSQNLGNIRRSPTVKRTFSNLAGGPLARVQPLCNPNESACATRFRNSLLPEILG
jgi:hypothetical protein